MPETKHRASPTKSKQIVEVDMDHVRAWRWRIVVVGVGWTVEHRYFGPKFLARRHCRKIYHSGDLSTSH
ncbi:MAG: hypothetical protein JST73_03410 [Actinobacteria bacterium]|nr:hypothetical protein [Actinomycetota bacterium]